MSQNKIPVGVLAATGAVGQRFIQLLENHPWFDVVAVSGSTRSVGHKYSEVCRWLLPTDIPESVRNLIVQPSTPEAIQTPLVFSALPSSQAETIELLFTKAGAAICTNAGAFRQDPLTPILLPEVNPEHTALIAAQRTQRGSDGFIVTNPNCTSTGMTIALKALQNAFGVKRVFATSMQAISGAGYPGVPSLDILGNIVPYISGEEEKVAWEPRKMLGKVNAGKLDLAEIGFSIHANRVPVIDGHTVVLTIELTDPPAGIELARRALAEYQAPEISRQLPSTPKPVIRVRNEPNRPQPRLDITDGMTTVVGRVRPDDLFDLRMVVVSHNTIRGAAGGSIYNAELLLEQGFVQR
ncbi:MAG: aspartate-semialdehyde dehydrogenase [Anaerolineae bacterium]|jgi:aspartate-semialdehyde dehydrogenase|nr:aspartate-semialdehyde dehydrogenase [Anaerolineae bacterium]MBT7071854.1 aspartate-semialdehyde dehydrogenase [Anaerolineae bacterium]MBT7325412.1 aspartate-semialdehyde dehydrogenase [Anaerolineae bacterium]